MKPTTPIRLGASYYPEHWPRPRWQEDFALMREAGLEALRVGEFAWSALQPGPDQWDWEWLDQFFDDAHQLDLRILLCTPSACPPPWLIEAEPDILPLREDGTPMGLGGRRHYSCYHLGYRQRATDMADCLAQRYANHPALMGWQIDNELCGNVHDHGPLAQQAFQDWLRQHFEDHLDDFHQALGLQFWSQAYSSWQQVPLPTQGKQHPGLKKLYQECLSQHWIDFCAEQARAIRKYNNLPITTNCYGFDWGMDIDWRTLVEKAGLDAFSFDNYATSSHEACFYHDVGSSMGIPYWITEEQSGPYAANYPWPEDPQRVESMAREAREHGAEAILYFPWRQIPWGHEQEHGAILDHNGKPGLQFQRVKDTNCLLRKTSPVPVAQCGLVLSWQDSWAWRHAGLRLDYAHEIIQRCYQGIHLVVNRTRICMQPEDLADLEVVLIPFKCVYDPAWEQAICDMVARGGHVLCFAHTFARDTYNAYRPDYLGETMEALLGIRINRRIRLQKDAHISCDNALNVELVAEVLDLEDAQCISRFSDGPAPETPALTCKTHASGGAAWYCAGYPDVQGFAQLTQQLCQAAQSRQDQPEAAGSGARSPIPVNGAPSSAKGMTASKRI